MTAPVGVILAGGAARRMGGGDKGLLPLGHTTVIGHVIARFDPQVASLALNANGPADRFTNLNLPVLPDTVADLPGPLAGILAAMLWARNGGHTHVVTTPADTPFVHCDLVPQLMLAAEGSASGAAIAATDRVHPLSGLWPTTLADGLHSALTNGTRKVTDWTETLTPGIAAFPATTPDPFFNINTPQDLTQAEAWL